MAIYEDRLDELLNGYLAATAAAKAAGQRLEWLESYIAIINISKLPENFSLQLPLLIFYVPGAIEVRPDTIPRASMSCSSDVKIYTVRASLFNSVLERDNMSFYWHSGENYASDIIEKTQDVETTLRAQTFNNAFNMSTTTRQSYQDIALPKSYDGQIVEQSHIDFSHVVQLRWQ